MNERIQKIKTHFRENKKVYITGGICLVAGAVGTLVVINRKSDAVNVATAIGLWGSRSEINPTVINLIERSTPSKPVHLVGTNLYYSSLHEAARETGHSVTKISKQVNGHIPDINGDVFEVLEPAA